MCKNLQADGEGTVQGTEGANAQRHKGPLVPPEKGRPGQESEVSLIRAAPDPPDLRRVWMALGTWQSLWAWRRRACPLVLFLGKKEELWWGWGPGAFSEARGASDAPAPALPA